jgi:hypothetical protein
MLAVDAVTVLGFSAAARRLADEARRRGLVVPGFRSPPRLAGAVRSLRRVPGDVPIVAVRRRGRQGDDIVGDMVDGVVLANGLSGAEAARVRAALLEAVRPPTATFRSAS